MRLICSPVSQNLIAKPNVIAITGSVYSFISVQGEGKRVVDDHRLLCLPLLIKISPVDLSQFS